jgi:hypothetical protein
MNRPESEGKVAEGILLRHIEAVRGRDVSGLMRDYADDAVVDIGAGLFSGRLELLQMCRLLVQVPGIDTFEALLEYRQPGVVLEHWTMCRDTAAARSGTDIIVIRCEKIVFQVTRARG